MQTEFLLGTRTDWHAILWMVERLSICLTAVDLRISNFRSFGVKIPRKESSCSISPLGKANTMWIRLPRILNEDCDKKRGAANIQALRQWDISTMCGRKVLSLIKNGA